jgi:hypothetical protein
MLDCFATLAMTGGGLAAKWNCCIPLWTVTIFDGHHLYGEWDTLVDALAGAVLAARSNAAIVLMPVSHLIEVISPCFSVAKNVDTKDGL